MIKTNDYTVSSTEPVRIDVYLSKVSSLTRSRIKNLCDEGNVLLFGKPVKSNKIVKYNDIITLNLPEDKPLDLTPLDIPLEIVYQDEDLAVINKPQGLTVHAGNGTKGDTLVNVLLSKLDKLSGINGVIRPGIVHRIDKNTSGLLIVAKNDKSHLFLAKQLEDKTLKREYIALLEGVLKTDSGTVSTFIARDKNNRTKMAVSSDGKMAITDYRVVKRFEGYTLCKFSLKTGRTHQIRVHSKYLGHPIVGDIEYGYKNNKFKLNGQLLHAFNIEFIHPTLNKKMKFTVDIPDYFKAVIKKLKEI